MLISFGILAHLLWASPPTVRALLLPDYDPSPGTIRAREANEALHRELTEERERGHAREIRDNFERLMMLFGDVETVVQYAFLSGRSAYAVASVQFDLTSLRREANGMRSTVNAVTGWNSSVNTMIKEFRDKMWCFVNHVFIECQEIHYAPYVSDSCYGVEKSKCLPYFLSQKNVEKFKERATIDNYAEVAQQVSAFEIGHFTALRICDNLACGGTDLVSACVTFDTNTCSHMEA